MQDLIQFFIVQREKIGIQILEHLGLTFLSILLACIIALPLGILISRQKRWAGFVLGFSGVLQTIPSLALLGILIPLMGIGYLPALFALFLYALMPIIRNTYAGITGVSETVTEAATAMGMNKTQRLLKIELPLALPVILAGVRTATVINVGVATLAAYIGAGGLGEFIFGGISLNNSTMMLAGAIPAALLALVLDFILFRLQKFSMAGLKRTGLFAAGVLLLLIAVYAGKALFRDHSQNRKSLLAGLTPEFIGRADGYPGLQEKYKLNIRNVVISDAIMYKAAYDGKLDVISGYSTDGRLKSYHLVILRDNLYVFPPYYAAPLVNAELLQKHPEVEAALDQLSGKISDSEMTDMNYQVDFLKKSPEEVAMDFLKKKGLYRTPLSASGERVRLGAKIFGEQQILVTMYSMLIRGNTHLNTEIKANLGGTQIVFGALQHGNIDLYPEYTGTGLQVILRAPASSIAKLTSDKDSLYQYVKREFLKKYKMKWLKPDGFDNTYALMMPEKEAETLHIKSISDLVNYLKSE